MLRIMISLWFCSCLSVGAQDFDLPTYKTPRDYLAHELEVIQAITWLIEHPIDHPDRQKANAYVLLWIEGSPNVTVEVDGFVMPLTDNNPDLLMLYIGAWVRYALTTDKREYTVAAARLQALQTVVAYYQTAQGIRKDQDLDKVVKMVERGKLDKWIALQIKG